MLQVVSPQKSDCKNNEGKSKTASCDINCQNKTADILSSTDKIQEVDKAS